MSPRHVFWDVVLVFCERLSVKPLCAIIVTRCSVDGQMSAFTGKGLSYNVELVSVVLAKCS